ncbi:MAG: archaellin/type IV pilin N-terminal domain-containing protein [Candidatus Heimdallarchaeaceae archaeon]|jgi:flagellin-like protein
MKKRGVSPVIATILLIALVTAAAAIVFLVVIPMLNPVPEAIVKSVQANEASGNYTITFTVLATGGDIVFDGTVTSTPAATFEVITAAGLEITSSTQATIQINGIFTVGEVYNFNIYFSSGDSEVIGIGEKLI